MELTSPPVPLVALIGAPELLPAIADYLRTQHLPSLHCLGLTAAHSAAGSFGERRGGGDRRQAATAEPSWLHSIPAAARTPRIAGARKAAPATGPPQGILKAGWLRKHRNQRPAVAALLVDREAGGWGVGALACPWGLCCGLPCCRAPMRCSARILTSLQAPPPPPVAPPAGPSLL